jgi:hypothetical protein
MGKACSKHTAVVIYTTFIGNRQAKRPSENVTKDRKITSQQYDLRVTNGLNLLKICFNFFKQQKKITSRVLNIFRDIFRAHK